MKVVLFMTNVLLMLQHGYCIFLNTPENITGDGTVSLSEISLIVDDSSTIVASSNVITNLTILPPDGDLILFKGNIETEIFEATNLLGDATRVCEQRSLGRGNNDNRGACSTITFGDTSFTLINSMIARTRISVESDGVLTFLVEGVDRDGNPFQDTQQLDVFHDESIIGLILTLSFIGGCLFLVCCCNCFTMMSAQGE